MLSHPSEMLFYILMLVVSKCSYGHKPLWWSWINKGWQFWINTEIKTIKSAFNCKNRSHVYCIKNTAYFKIHLNIFIYLLQCFDRKGDLHLPISQLCPCSSIYGQNLQSELSWYRYTRHYIYIYKDFTETICVFVSNADVYWDQLMLNGM